MNVLKNNNFTKKNHYLHVIIIILQSITMILILLLFFISRCSRHLANVFKWRRWRGNFNNLNFDFELSDLVVERFRVCNGRTGT